jgi:hypothetical protein
MNNIPNGGKVVIVDDRFQEILPLINILNFNAIPVIYYSGKQTELPLQPLNGVRLFFLDLRFSSNTDTKTIVSNASNILKTILGEFNGPYLLIIWSSTGNDYKEDLEKELADKSYGPEFILCLSKQDYFETKESNAYSLMEDIKKVLKDEEVENVERVMSKVELRVLSDADEVENIFIPANMGKLRDELYDGLKKAGLLSLFIIWENTVRDSVPNVVNEIYSQIPESIPPDKKLPAMVYYLAKNRLEKQFEKVKEKEKFCAALMELNELYTYFYSEEVINIPLDGFLPINIQKNTDLVPSQSRFNSWKMITQTIKGDTPGSIYKDSEKTFEFFGLVKDYLDKIKYKSVCDCLRSDENIIYIWANINGECDTAQDKYTVVRVIPGALIPCDVYTEYEEKGTLKSINSAGDYIYKELPPFEFEGGEYYLIFNMHQCTYIERENLTNLEVCFALHRKYYLSLRQHLAADYAKQGIDLYKK